MNKRFFSLVIAAGLVVTNVPLSSANEIEGNVKSPTLEISNEQKSGASLVSKQSSIKYSDFLKDGGGWQWVDLELKGAKITTKDPEVFDKAITQNYDVQTTFALPPHGTSFEFGVFAPNPGIEYIDNWEITIDSSVLDIDQDLTIKIPVENDIGTTVTPKIVANKKSVTKEELLNGFDLTLETINGAKFNTSCMAYGPRVSIIKTANLRALQVLPYCNDISSNRITFHIKAVNGIPSYSDTLEFRMEGDALINSKVPLMVKLDIVSDVNQSDLDKLKDMIKNAPNVTLSEYTKESYAKFQSTIREATRIAYSNNPGQTEVKEMINRLSDVINNLEKLENLDEVVNIDDISLKNAIKKSLGLKSDAITVGDMKKVKSLNFEDDMYLQNLRGLEHATNLESLNLNYNEVTDISPLKNLVNLKEITGLENFVMDENTARPTNNKFFELEYKAIDIDGKKITPSKVVLSPNQNPKELDLEEVLVDGKIRIDSSLVSGTDAVEVLYESQYNNFQLYSFHFLNNK
ncbi:MAG: leucine-rich repeat domain-containing protein [Peptostreptococcaceae bacterium]